MGKKKLKAPKGTDQVNFGENSFQVDPATGEVEVPEEAVPGLLSVGGCVEVIDAVPVPEGFVALFHDDTETSCSWGGVTYSRLDDGAFQVPAVAVLDLLSHGYSTERTRAAEPAVPETNSSTPIPQSPFVQTDAGSVPQGNDGASDDSGAAQGNGAAQGDGAAPPVVPAPASAAAPAAPAPAANPAPAPTNPAAPQG